MGLLTWGDVGSQVSQTASPQIWSLEVDDLSGQAARSVVSTSLQPHWGCNPIVYQAPHQWDFSWQEYWSGFPFPPPEDLPDPGIKPTFPASPKL